MSTWYARNPASDAEWKAHDPTSIGSPPATFATWNPSDKSAAWTLSEGNLRAAVSSSPGATGVRGTLSHTSGKYYWEFSQTTGASFIGVASLDQIFADSYSTAETAGWYQPAGFGWVWGNNGWLDFNGPTIATGIWGGIAIDLGAGLFWFRSSSTSRPTGPGRKTTPIAGTRRRTLTRSCERTGLLSR